MPDALRKDPSSEDLDAVVNDKETTPQLVVRDFPQAKQPTETTVNNNNDILNRTPGQCFKCDQSATDFCKHCGQEFCASHKSKYSDGICCSCVAASNLGIEYVDYIEEEQQADGRTIQHKGRRIKLIGEGWPNAMQLIETLNDEGLEVFIAERKRLLEEAIKLGEYHRITLSAAEFKKEYQRRSKIAKLRRRREELQAQGQLRVSGKVVDMGKKQKAKLSEEEKAAQAMGCSVAEWRALKALLGGKK